MLISVIVPIYKGEKYINRIIRNIEANVNIDYFQIEIIFVNDYPEDFLGKADFSSQVNLEFINHNQNKGIHKTKVDGFMKSKGKYILFLDQDDTIETNYFNSQLIKIGEYDSVFCNGYHRQGEPIYCSGEMKTSGFDLINYMAFGSPLISLGQMLIRREAVPKEWIRNIMNCNGWDDQLFWVCLMHEKASVIYNDEHLYVHEEAENNASFNWNAMKNSAIEFREKIIQLKILRKNNEKEFVEVIEKKIAKCEKYIELDSLINYVKGQEVNDYLCRNSIYAIAIYGVGVYGRKFYQMIDSKRICIKYGIDRNAQKKTADFPIFKEVKKDIPIDCIVCATGFDDENVKKHVGYKAITLKEILLAIQPNINDQDEK